MRCALRQGKVGEFCAVGRDADLLAIEVITVFDLPVQGQRVGLLEVKANAWSTVPKMIAVLSEQRSRRIQAEQRCEQDKNQCCNALRHNGNHILHVGLSRAEDASTSGSALTELRGVSSGRANYNMALGRSFSGCNRRKQGGIHSALLQRVPWPAMAIESDAKEKAKQHGQCNGQRARHNKRVVKDKLADAR